MFKYLSWPKQYYNKIWLTFCYSLLSSQWDVVVTGYVFRRLPIFLPRNSFHLQLSHLNCKIILRRKYMLIPRVLVWLLACLSACSLVCLSFQVYMDYNKYLNKNIYFTTRKCCEYGGNQGFILDFISILPMTKVSSLKKTLFLWRTAHFPPKWLNR